LIFIFPSYSLYIREREILYSNIRINNKIKYKYEKPKPKKKIIQSRNGAVKKRG